MLILKDAPYFLGEDNAKSTDALQEYVIIFLLSIQNSVNCDKTVEILIEANMEKALIECLKAQTEDYVKYEIGDKAQ